MFTFSVFAGNGSSGVGNASVPITSYMESWTPTSNVIKVGNDLIDKSNNEKILEILPISKSEHKKLLNKFNFVKTQLGGVKGLEFSPAINEKKSNYWVFCDKDDASCVKLSVKAKKNINIRPIIGNLRGKK